MAQLQTSTVSGNLNVTGSLVVTGSSTFLSTLSGTSAQFVAITCSNFSPAIAISPAGATNQIQFNSGSALSADPNFVWDNVNDRLGVGTSTPNFTLSVTGTLGVSDASVIDVSSTSAALRVTQRGTGESLRIEDSTNPDSTPFVISSTGQVGIGTDSPQSRMHISGTGDVRIDGGSDLIIRSTSQNSNGRIRFIDTGSIPRATLYAGGTDILRIADTTIDRLIVDSAGNVGIGTDSTQAGFARLVIRPQAGNIIGLTQVSNTSSIVAWNDSGVSNTLRVAGNPLVFTGNGGSGAEHMRIDSAGNVGIGTTSPSSLLHVNGNTLVAGDLAVNGGDITSTSALLNISSSGDVRINKDIFVIDNSLFVSGSSALVVDRRGAGDGTGGIYFVSASVPLEQFSAGSGTLTLDGVISSTVSRFQMLSVNKDLHLSAQPNLLNNPIPAITQNDKSPWPIGIGTTYASGIDVYIKGTAITIEGNISVPSGGSLQLTGSNIAFSSGNGVDFSANSNAAGMTSELLDDYEEGSFTPTLAGPTSITYDAAGRQGNYVKVGDLVLVTIRIEPASIAGAGALTITGLPFVSSGTSFGTTWIANCRANNLATSLITVIGEIGGGSTTVSLFKRTASSTTDTALLASDLNASSAIRVTLSYRTA